MRVSFYCKVLIAVLAAEIEVDAVKVSGFANLTDGHEQVTAQIGSTAYSTIENMSELSTEISAGANTEFFHHIRKLFGMGDDHNNNNNNNSNN